MMRLPREVASRTIEALQKFLADPKAPTLHYEPLNQMRDAKVRTIRANLQYRIVLVAPEKGVVHHAVHVGNHDEAMAWAERKRFAFDEHEGLSLVDVADWEALMGPLAPSEPSAPPAAAPAPEATAAGPEATAPTGPWAQLTEAEAQRLGVPAFLLPGLWALPHAEALYDAVGTLSETLMEGLLALAEGRSVAEVLEARESKAWAESIAQAAQAAAQGDPAAAGASQAHPLAPAASEAAPLASGGLLVQAPEELAALLADWQAWQVYLHPSQQTLVEQSWSGPARVLGGAGTGKTVVLLHRAVRLAKAMPPGEKLLVTTFTKALAGALQANLSAWQPEAAQRMEVTNLSALAFRVLREAKHPTAKLKAVNVDDDEALKAWRRAQDKALEEEVFAPAFLAEEYLHVVAAQGIRKGQDYLTAPRVGRGKALSRGQRQELWSAVEAFHQQLEAREQATWAQVYLAAAGVAEQAPPYAHVLVDEAQDLDGAAYAFVRALVARKRDDVFLVGDAYQRIYGARVSLERVGLPVRGRSAILRLNYRTTEDIRRWAVARVAALTPDAMDGDAQDLKGYRALLRGPQPQAKAWPSSQAEREAVVAQLRALGPEQWREGVALAAHHRRTVEDWAAFLQREGLPVASLADGEGIQVRTMHDMKGLEFKQVFLVGVNAREFPGPSEADPQGADRQRALLYVAATRARDALHVSCWGTPSPLVHGWA